MHLIKTLIYQDILHLIKLLQLNTAAILDLPSYTYVKCFSLKETQRSQKPVSMPLNSFAYINKIGLSIRPILLKGDSWNLICIFLNKI